MKSSISRSLSAIRKKTIRLLGGVPATKSSRMVEFARSEMNLAWPERDDMQDAMKSGLIDLVSVFAEQGHSGFSASYTRSVLEKLLNFEPVTQLTGEDHEWSEPFDDDGTQQNKRCGRVFRDVDGNVYDIDGRVFREPNGSCYTNRESRVFVKFPYTPKTEYVDVAEESIA